MKPKICVSIMPRSTDEAKALQDSAGEKGADFVEVRLDRLEGLSRLKSITLPKTISRIATNRSVRQGGEFRGGEDKRFRTLLSAAQAGFDYIDLEDSLENLDEKMDTMRSLGAKVVVSHHNRESTPPVMELNKVLNKISRLTPDVCKIVTTAKCLHDNLITFDFLQEKSKALHVVCFAMGDLGRLSRIVCPIFGSFFTIASLEKGSETAPGQITIDDLKIIYERMGFS